VGRVLRIERRHDAIAIAIVGKKGRKKGKEREKERTSGRLQSDDRKLDVEGPAEGKKKKRREEEIAMQRPTTPTASLFSHAD